MKKKTKVLISGGGTGGHVFPAIAIANALKAIDNTIDIQFIGAEGKIEMEKVPKAGYSIEGLNIRGFYRKLTFGNIIKNIQNIFNVLASMRKVKRIIKQFEPDVAVGVGGYASGPALRTASKMGIPCLINEQNSFAGQTNRLLANNAKTICVAYENMDKTFASEKLVNTGNPVRQDIWNMKLARNECFKHFDFNDSKKTIMIVGGSLGAKSINEAMRANYELLSKNADVQILWQAGKLYIEEFSQSNTAKLPNVKITAFIDRMDMAYAISDIVIARAGALTISELCLVGKPAILIPSPNVAEDHQTHNAQALVSKDAAILVKDANAKESMIQTALNIINDPKQQAALSNNIEKLAKPNAANDIAKEVLKLVEN